jgi:hypothetical protein
VNLKVGRKGGVVGRKISKKSVDKMREKWYNIEVSRLRSAEKFGEIEAQRSS